MKDAWETKGDFSKKQNARIVREIGYRSCEEGVYFARLQLKQLVNEDFTIMLELKPERIQSVQKSLVAKGFPASFLAESLYEISIPNLNFMKNLLTILSSIQRSVNEISDDLIAFAELHLKNQPEIEGWISRGKLHDEIYSGVRQYISRESKAIIKTIDLKFWNLDKTYKIEITPEENQYKKLTQFLVSQGYSKSEMDDVCGKYVFTIHKGEALSAFLIVLTQFDRGISQTLKEDILYSYNPKYDAKYWLLRQSKMAFFMGFHDRVGGESAIHSVLKSNKAADSNNLAGLIFNYLGP